MAKAFSKPQYSRVPANARDVRVVVAGKPHWTQVVKTIQIGQKKILVTDTYGQQPLSAVKRMYVTVGESKGRFTGHKPIWRVLSGAVSPDGLLKAQSARRERARGPTHTKEAGPARRTKQEGARVKLEKDKRNPNSIISKVRESFLLVCDQIDHAKMAQPEAERELRLFLSDWTTKLTPTEVADLQSAIENFLTNR